VAAGTAARLDAARQWLAGVPRDQALAIVAPHALAADALVHAEVAEGGARFGVHRYTPSRLASQLAATGLARAGIATGSGLTLGAVVARAVHALLAAGEVGRFAPVADRPGFPHALAATLSELREAGVPGAALRDVPPWGPELSVVLERVEQELAGLRLADRAGVYALAVAALEAGAPPAGLPLLLLDLPLERRRERDLIAALVARAPRVLATAPAGDQGAIAFLEERLGVSAEREDAGEETSLARLQRHLFEVTAPPARPLDATVALASWPGEAREAVEIARGIAAEAARGVPFDRMAVLLRSPAAYRAHVEEALRRADIPAWFAHGTTRPDPAGRAVLALLACAAEGLSARRFAEYVSLAQVPGPDAPVDAWTAPDHDLMPASPPALAVPAPGGNGDGDGEGADPAVDGAVRAPWRWERLLVDAAVIGGRERWSRRLAGLTEEIRMRRGELQEEDARAATLDRVAADLAHLRTFALPLIERLASLPTGAPWEEWLRHLRELTAAAIRDPAGVLRVLAELEPLAPVGPVDLEMVQHVLAPRLHDLTVAPGSRCAGAVFVGPVEMARGLAFDVVFVPGLAEKVFPQRLIEDPLLPDESRRRMDGHALVNQDARVAAERLNLRLAAGAARRRVVLSWPRIDLDNARPRVPSFYGLEAMRAAEGVLPGFDDLRRRGEADGGARLGWPAPARAADAIDDTEYDLAVLAQVQGGDPAAGSGAAHYLLQANPHLARALRARGRRWSRLWTSFDGLVPPHEKELAVPASGETAAALHAHAVTALTRHQMGARSFSPTALEHFSACPYRFLLQAVHRLQPRKEAEALETIDPLTRGSLFHEVQFRVLTALRDRGNLPLDPRHLEDALAVLDRVMTEVADEYEERLAPAIPRVWTDGVTAIRGDLREWLRRATEDAQGWVPHRFEWSFGLVEHARPTADASSVAEPVEIVGGARLRGSIDLVERRADGHLRVTDHKTGKARVPHEAVIWGGQALQPVLYALAAERGLGAPVEGGRLYYCTADGEFSERVIPLDDESRGAAATAIGVVSRALARGFLPAAPREGACLWCDYRLVCGPFEESRTGRKPADPLRELHQLRELP
jgi:RecB family exonuclease